MSFILDLFWRLLPDVRSHERERFAFFAALGTLGSAAQTLGLVGAESLFLAEFGVSLLPVTYIAASLLTVAGSFAYAMRVGEARNDRLFIQMLLGAFIVLAASGVGIVNGGKLLIPVVFCFWYLAQAVFLNHFLTFTGDYFDSLATKRIFPRLSIGASLGGAAGGAAAAFLADVYGPGSLILGWALLFGLCALLLRAGHAPLRRWGPLELEEADETSVEGMQGAVRYLGRSSLGRWLVVSAIGMVLSLFIANYIYSGIFIRAFPNPTELAAFIGIYLAVTNVVEIFIGFFITPWIIQRLGVPTANLIHPVLTLISFGALALNQGLRTGIVARLNRELVDNAMAFPVRSLVYNAMPLRLRGRMRAFLEGIVVYAGMSMAGLVLLVAGAPDPLWLCALGSAAALIFLGANLMARREYLRELVGQLRSGRLDLDDIGDEIGKWGATRLAELWEELLQNEGARPSRSLLELIPNLASRGITDPILRATTHANPDVRRSCVNALASIPGEEIDGALARCLDDSNSAVRLAALRGVVRRGRSAPLGDRIHELAQDPDPQVRCEAALQLGDDGLGILDGMIRSSDPAEASAGLRVAPDALVDRVLERMGDPNPAIRASALEAVTRLGPDPPPSKQFLLDALTDDEPRVRRAAVMLLANLEDDDSLVSIASALGDPSADVQFTAETILGSLEDEGVEAATPSLRAERERSVYAALRVLSSANTDLGHVRLIEELRHRIRQLWYDVIAFQRLPVDEGTATVFLRAAYQDDMLRSHRLAFRTLVLLEDQTIIRKVDKTLRTGSERSRGDALEVLSNLGDREASELLVLMHEAGDLGEKIPRALRFVGVPLADGIVEASTRSESRWIRMAADAYSVTDPPAEAMMQRLLALKQVPLFSKLSLEQLEAVQQITTEVEYVSDEVIMREGEPGGELFLLIEGSVRVYKGYGTERETLLSTMQAVSYIGEMATLDDEPRSATVVAADASRLLRLEGSSLKELILQMPEISFEIFRILTARVRVAEERLGQL
jgi:HEAT repeat protein